MVPLMPRLRALWRWKRLESELDEEIRFHLSEEAEERAASGANRFDAEAAAHKDFGSTARTLEATRDAWRSPLLAGIAQDLRYAVRSMRRHRGFSIIATLTLGIGLGASAAIVSVADTILLQPLPYPDADRLVQVVERFPTISGIGERGISYAEFVDWRANSRTFSDAAAISAMAQRTVTTSNGVAGLWGAMASGNAFSVLKTKAFLGRTLESMDDANPDVVLLSHDTWTRHFSSDPRVVGSTVELRAGALQSATPPRLLTVVGVLPADFAFERYDFFTPIVVRAGQRSPRVTTIGRLRDGISLDAANEEASALGAAIRSPWPSEAAPLQGPRFYVQSLKERAVAEVRPALRMFVGAVAVVLLIVCANVANLLLARGSSRRAEIATRLAIGASRARIVRQIFTECLLLALAGGVVGAACAAAGVSLITSLATVDAPGIFRLMFGSTVLPRAQEVHVSFTLIAIVFGIGALAAVAFGLLPAIQLSRTHFSLTSNARGRSHGRADVSARRFLVVGQLVLATVLLIGAGLLLRSLWSLSAVDKGYDSRRVVAMNLLLPDQYAVGVKADIIATVLHALRALPQVQAAGFSRHGLLIGEEITLGVFLPPGRSEAEMSDAHIRIRPVSGGFLTAMGVPIIKGREFSSDDDASPEPLVVMNQMAARLCFGTASPVDQIMSWTLGQHSTPVRVIGVVDNLRQSSLTDEFFPEIFFDYRQLLTLFAQWGESPARQNETGIGFLSFAILTRDGPESALSTIRHTVHTIDPSIGIDALVPMSRLVDSSLTRPRFYASVLGVFAGVAGFLAAIGVYGVLAYAVAERTREIGIRMALGARRLTVLSMVLRQGLALSVLGIGIGMVVAAVAAPMLSSLLFGVQPLDTATFVIISPLFAAVSTIACLVPARRATSVDPAVALRCD